MKNADNWFHIPVPRIPWLVDGLITADGHTSVSGKPKCGKSLLVRNLIVAVIKSIPFLGRGIGLPPGSGRVLYVHLDRKDSLWRVAKELRDLGIAEEESERLLIRTEKHLPPDSTAADRLAWLQREVQQHKPHLVVIDLLWQFLTLDGSANDYNAVLNGINDLQDALRKSHYGGALVVAIHARKATNPNETFDDMLGSTGHRGSFSTNITLSRRRDKNVYVIASDQTERDDVFGEIPETVIERSPDGKLALGLPLSKVLKAANETRTEADVQRLLAYLEDHPGIEMRDIIEGLGVSKKTAMRLVELAGEFVVRRGKGFKGDPHLYYAKDISKGGLDGR
jgi:hypothetical protein